MKNISWTWVLIFAYVAALFCLAAYVIITNFPVHAPISKDC